MYYSLAIYYHFVEKDNVRALKCVEKMLILKPDHEDGCILYFHILTENANLPQAYAALETVSKLNPLLAFPYYFLGIRSQNTGDYATARLYFENAARYHAFNMQ